MIRLAFDTSIYVAVLVVSGPLHPRDARVLWDRIDQIGRTRGTASILLDVTDAEGPPPPIGEMRPLAVPGAVVRVAVLGEGAAAEWALDALWEMGLPAVRRFAHEERSDAEQFVRTGLRLPGRPPPGEDVPDRPVSSG